MDGIFIDTEAIMIYGLMAGKKKNYHVIQKLMKDLQEA